MLTESAYTPGQEVQLKDGTTGVLYARTWHLGRRASHSDEPSWYFLPDNAAAVGLVVMSQPGEIRESMIAEGRAQRPGNWPPSRYWLTQPMREAVYVAHMQRRPLPLPAD